MKRRDEPYPSFFLAEGYLFRPSLCLKSELPKHLSLFEALVKKKDKDKDKRNIDVYLLFIKWGFTQLTTSNFGCRIQSVAFLLITLSVRP